MIISRPAVAVLVLLVAPVLGACSSSSPAPSPTTASSAAGSRPAGAAGRSASTSAPAPSGSSSFTPGASGGGAGSFRVAVSKLRVPVPPPAVAGDNYDVTGTIQGCLTGGRWTYSGSWRIVSRSAHDGNVDDNGGAVLDLRGGQAPAPATLTLAFAPTEADNAKLPASVRDGQGQFVVTAASGTPRVALRAFRGTGEALPLVTLAVTPQTPQCG